MKSREKLLISLFGILLLVGGGLVLWDLYRDRRDALEAERKRLEAEWVEIDALLENRERWLRRASWLEEHQPRFVSRNRIDKAIFETARAEEVEGVTTSEIQLLDGRETPHFVEAGARLKARGTLEAVFRWFHRLQAPSNFRVIRNCKVVPDPEDEAKILCEFELLRWYAPEE